MVTELQGKLGQMVALLLMVACPVLGDPPWENPEDGLARTAAGPPCPGSCEEMVLPDGRALERTGHVGRSCVDPCEPPCVEGRAELGDGT